MNSRNSGGNAAERTAAGPARFGIPGLELTRRTAQPQQDAVLLRLLRFRREYRVVKEPRKARNRRGPAPCQTLEKQPPMQPVFIRPALAGKQPR